MDSFDFAVIGAGIAGASVAAELVRQAPSARVALLEMERQPGYHTTGRSAAVFAPSYGPAPIRALTRASRAFFETPPHGFTETPLFSPRRILMIARTDQQAALEALVADVSSKGRVSVLDARALRDANPLVRQGYAASAMLDEGGQDIDVAALHQGFLRMFRAAGGAVLTGAEVTALDRDADGWAITCRTGAMRAGVVVNAAGAWADRIGTLAGAEPIGLQPKRRTAAIVAAPEGVQADDYPITIDVEEQFYLKPDAGRLLISPADETPSDPCDAQPEELDIAICVDRVERAFELSVRRIENKWAGLRSFVPDKSPVAGYSGRVPGFFWLAGQGGYGIQTAPALARFSATMILGQPMDDPLTREGFAAQDVSPARLA